MWARPARRPRSSRYLAAETIGSFFRQAADGARAVHKSLSEQLLNVGVRARLVLARKVQVDIRHLVALKAQKYLKRDGIPVFGKRLAAQTPQVLSGRSTPTAPNSGGVNRAVWQWSQR